MRKKIMETCVVYAIKSRLMYKVRKRKRSGGKSSHRKLKGKDQQQKIHFSGPFAILIIRLKWNESKIGKLT